jgi:aminoglycoside phosphotransferase (APT) family kinase protein
MSACTTHQAINSALERRLRVCVDQTDRVNPIGPRIAEGRDSEIFKHGPGRVLRIARDGRSLVAEAEIMRYVRAHGYSCPEVYDAGDGYLVMDHLDGPTMMDSVGKPPFPLRRSGHVLAELHEQLHQIPAPPGMPPAPLPGDRLVHLDLHPMNVMMTSSGPVVIDWANAAAGDPAFDVADTWVLFACATAPTSGIDRFIVPIGRHILLRAFLSRVDTVAARRAIPAAVEHRLTDPNMSPDEQARMRQFAAKARND